MVDLCKGCSLRNSKRTTVDYCFFRSYRHQDKCPCIQCLVKPMCTRACEDRINIKKRLFKIACFRG